MIEWEVLTSARLSSFIDNHHKIVKLKVSDRISLKLNGISKLPKRKPECANQS
jgi:hypothetical protein